MVVNVIADSALKTNGKENFRPVGDGLPNSAGCRRIASFKDIGSRESVQASLDSRSASDELLQFWANEEERSFGHSAAIRETGLEANARKACCWSMANHMMNVFPERYWFEAISILDTYTSLSPTPVEVAQLPALCEAILFIVWKFDDAVASMAKMCPQRCENYAQCLGATGYPIDFPLVTQDTVNAQELQVLQALNWKMPRATVESWMSAFCARMYTVTGQLLVPTLSSIYPQSVALARIIIAQVASTQLLSPQRVARGLFAIGCIAGRVLPPELLGFDTDESFGDIFSAVAFSAHPARAELLPFIIELLEFCCQCTLSCLKDDCKRIGTLLRSARNVQHCSV